MTSAVKYTSENNVVLIYDLTLGDGTHLTGRKDCKSGDSLGVKQWYYNARVADDDGQWRHQHDPDAQVFEWLANEVWLHYGRSNAAYTAGAANTVGTITLGDDQGPCRSCRSVIKAFKRDFPQVSITVKYPKRDAFKITPGLGGGVYGYDDAVEVKGFWSRVV